MRKLILTATGFVCLAGGAYFLTPAQGQDNGKTRKEAPAAEDKDIPHRIGVVDVDYIFENYKKVNAEVEELKDEARKTDEKLKVMQRQGQDKYEEYKTLKDGSSEKKAMEERLTQLQALFDAKKKSFQNEIKREQAKMQLTIYQEIQDAVKVVANHNNITLVVKASRNETGSASDPMRTQVMMNQACIFHRKQDDMTETVLNLLNKKYLRENPEAANAVTPAGNEEPAAKRKPSKVKTANGTKAAE